MHADLEQNLKGGLRPAEATSCQCSLLVSITPHDGLHPAGANNTLIVFKSAKKQTHLIVLYINKITFLSVKQVFGCSWLLMVFVIESHG